MSHETERLPDGTTVESLSGPDLEELKHTLARGICGVDRNTGRCVGCGSTKVTPEDFKDDLSRKEWGISQLCQACQDAFFDGGDDEDWDEEEENLDNFPERSGNFPWDSDKLPNA